MDFIFYSAAFKSDIKDSIEAESIYLTSTLNETLIFSHSKLTIAE